MSAHAIYCKGFTLIELMIVVAIIGILASFAIPSYQDYVNRTQVSRAFFEVSGFKKPIEDRMLQGAGVPATLSELAYTNSNILNITIANITINTATNQASVSATLAGNVSPAIAGAIISIDRQTDGEWLCTVNPAAAPGWKASYLPVGCS